MDFKELAELMEKLEKISAKIPKINLIASFLRKLSEEEVEMTVHLMLGRFCYEWEERELNVSWNTLVKVWEEMGVNIKELVELYKKTGDPGDAIKKIMEKEKIKRQSLLVFQKPTIKFIYEKLNEIAKISGEGSRDKKKAVSKALYSILTPVESKFLTRIILGDMRYGVSEGVLLESISKASLIPLEELRKAYMIIGDLGLTARKALFHREEIRNAKITVFHPIKPMLAEKADSVLEALKEHDFNTAFEIKFDGVRAQIHKKGNEVKIFSRRLKEVTEYFPEIVKEIREKVNANEVVMEGEIIGEKDGKPLPFQVLMRRLRREKEFERIMKEIPVKLYLFDIMYLDGKMLIDLPFSERRKILEEITPGIEKSPMLITKDPKKAEEFFRKAVEEGHEGIMAKKLDSKYIPGKRQKLWLKIKSHLEPLDLVIVAAEWGHGRRRNWLSDYYLAVMDEETGKFYVVGKTFKGLSDEEMEELTKKLLELKIREVGRIVYVKPKIVVEVLYDEIQESPKYECGYALRFARINRIRWDKGPEDADTLQRLIEIYKGQRKIKRHPF